MKTTNICNDSNIAIEDLLHLSMPVCDHVIAYHNYFVLNFTRRVFMFTFFLLIIIIFVMKRFELNIIL